MMMKNELTNAAMMLVVVVFLTAGGPSAVTAAFVPGSFVAGEATCVGCFRSALDCDWYDNSTLAMATSLLTPTLTPSDDAGCAALCLVNTRCTYYTFTSLAPGYGFCFLKGQSYALYPVTASNTGSGSSCGWLFGRSAETTPPAFVTAFAKSSSSSSAVAASDLLELAKLQNPQMRAYLKMQKRSTLEPQQQQQQQDE